MNTRGCPQKWTSQTNEHAQVSTKVDKPNKWTRASVHKSGQAKQWTRAGVHKSGQAKQMNTRKCPQKWIAACKMGLYVYTKIFDIDIFFHWSGNKRVRLFGVSA